MTRHRRSLPFLRLALAAATAAFVPLGPTGGRPAEASLVMALDLPALTSRADRIVVAEVLSVKSGWDKNRERILSTIEVQVAEVWKGATPGGTGRLTLVQPGGVADGIEMKVHGLPSFAAGERAVLFLRGSGGEAGAAAAAAGPLALVGLGQGKRSLRFDVATKQWMADAGDRSAVIQLKAQGKPDPEGTDRPMALDDLRRRVKALVKAR
jgi:hypothetical protein